MSKKQDVDEARFWQRTLREAARSGVSTREFCRQRRLAARRPASAGRKEAGEAARFALVSAGSGAVDAGIELVLADGRRLRMAKGVDEATLRSVLAALDPPGG